MKITDRPTVSLLTHLTEQAIVLLDDLLLMFNDFLYEFPDLVESKINKKEIGEHFPLVKFDKNDDSHRDLFLKRSPLADYASMAKLTGMSVEELEELFKPRYPINQRP